MSDEARLPSARMCAGLAASIRYIISLTSIDERSPFRIAAVLAWVGFRIAHVACATIRLERCHHERLNPTT